MSRGTIWGVVVLAALGMIILMITEVEETSEMSAWIELAAPILPWLIIVACAWVLISWLGLLK